MAWTTRLCKITNLIVALSSHKSLQDTSVFLRSLLICVRMRSWKSRPELARDDPLGDSIGGSRLDVYAINVLNRLYSHACYQRRETAHGFETSNSLLSCWEQIDISLSGAAQGYRYFSGYNLQISHFPLSQKYELNIGWYKLHAFVYTI